jgi:hypothetical protein
MKLATTLISTAALALSVNGAVPADKVLTNRIELPAAPK